MDRVEDLRGSARREALEETGLEIEIHGLLDIRHNESGGPQIFFEGEVVGGQVSSSWEGQPEFILKDEVKEKNWKTDHAHVNEYIFPDKE